MNKAVGLGVLLFLSLCAQAQTTIVEKVIDSYLSSPLNLARAGALTSAPTSGRINLLKWNENPQDPPAPAEHYNRAHHFGDWIVVQANAQDCTDTRAKVLIRESRTPVQMRAVNPCKVDTGAWYDPYTDRNYTSAQDIQIDHLVPLNDAYTNGAWRWNYQARCLYANFLGYRDHLKPVNGSENMQKGDKSPVEYMPPNKAYACEYIKSWLSIKLIWKLGMQRLEAQGIRQMLSQLGCNPKDFVFSTSDLAQLRGFIQSNLALCPQTPPVFDQHNHGPFVAPFSPNHSVNNPVVSEP